MRKHLLNLPTYLHGLNASLRVYFNSMNSMFPDQISANPHRCPVDDLNERDNAEPKEEAKESAKGGDKLDGSHRDPSLQFLFT